MTCELSTALLTPDLLSPDQQHAVQWVLDHKGAGLFLPMGAGKTVITLTAIEKLMYDCCEVERVLIVAPKQVAESVWHAEALKWAHTRSLEVGVCVGIPKHREAVAGRKIVVVNVENLDWLIQNYGLDGFDMVVLDEASLFKNPSSKRFRSLRRALTNQRVVALTGTPTGNKVENLWPVMYLLDKGERLLRTITAFRQAYMRPDKTNGHIVYSWALRPGAFEQILEKIADICLTMEVDPGCEVAYRDVSVKVPESAKRRMQEIARDLVSGDITAASAGVASGKLLQMSGGWCLDDERELEHIHSAKMDRLTGMLETMDEPVVVVYWYQHERAALLDAIDGAVDYKGPEQERAWNAGKIPVLLLHAAKGHGLNLQQGGRHMIWFTLTWSLEQYQQTCARLPRKGQKKTVYIHHLVGEGTIDEDVMAALQRREVTQQRVMDAVSRFTA